MDDAQIIPLAVGPRTLPFEASQLSPILDRKELYVNVARALSGAVSIDHLYGGFVVFTDGSGFLLGEAKLVEDRSKVAGNFAGGDGGQEFGFSGAIKGNCVPPPKG
jgi:hypothetical protein